MSEFESWWQRRGVAVEEFNERRGGESGVERVVDPELGPIYIKRQIGHLFHTIRYPFGRPTVIREQQGLAVFKKLGLLAPELVYVGAEKHQGQWRGILVTKEVSGYTDLFAWYEAGGRERLGEANHIRFLEKLGETLAQLHKHGWRHGSLYLKHIFVTPGDANSLPDIGFIDLERVRHHFFKQRAADEDLHQLHRRKMKLNDKLIHGDDDWKHIRAGHARAF